MKNAKIKSNCYKKNLLLTYMLKLSLNPSWVDGRERRPGLHSDDKIRFKLPRSRNNGIHSSPLFRGAKLWNNLGSWFQRSRDKLLFKKRLLRIPDLEKATPNPKDAVFDEIDNVDIWVRLVFEQCFMLDPGGRCCHDLTWRDSTFLSWRWRELL